jgi:FHS family L-fucose permease-like MFS transporter
MGVFASAFVIISFFAIPEPHLQKGGSIKTNFTHSPWSFRHTVLGVIGIFIYVGVEIGIPGTLNFYLADSSDKGAGLLTNGAAIGGAIAAIYWLLMLVGRSISSAISGKVSSRTQLIVVSAAAILFVLIAIFTPKTVTISMPGYSVTEGFNMSQVPLSALFLVLCGLSTSVMWGGIFNLAVEGLGKYTAQASGIFMMMVVGGGVLPLLQQFISDSVGYMASYWLIIAALVYLLFYGLVGSKNVNKDIPVE